MIKQENERGLFALGGGRLDICPSHTIPSFFSKRIKLQCISMLRLGFMITAWTQH